MQDTIVTVFGGSGFIGKYVISNLLKNGNFLLVMCKFFNVPFLPTMQEFKKRNFICYI